MITILGGHGNMGRRYGRILDEIQVPYQVLDLSNMFTAKVAEPTAWIFATPTDTHFDHINIQSSIKQFRGPILCEKPIMRFEHGFHFFDKWEEWGVNLQMVDQYAYCPRYTNQLSDRLSTNYESWHSGDDTLPWDCINIIAKAHDLKRVTLSNRYQKPHWRCRINGEDLKLEDMNAAYGAMLQAWLDDPKPNYDYMRHAHKAVLEYKKIQLDRMSTGA